MADAAYGFLDGPVAGTAAQVALERAWQVGDLVLIEFCCRHQETGRAEPALEARFDDIHGLPEWRRHMTYRYADEIRQELGRTAR
ncbi:hypothetical protein TNCT6_69750 [Streptomyces sp. 6-11-2]|nr:hypothetical protein TNCT6_69750 [Streptomyces sp. 6-11-2]